MIIRLNERKKGVELMHLVMSYWHALKRHKFQFRRIYLNHEKKRFFEHVNHPR